MNSIIVLLIMLITCMQAGEETREASEFGMPEEHRGEELPLEPQEESQGAPQYPEYSPQEVYPPQEVGEQIPNVPTAPPETASPQTELTLGTVQPIGGVQRTAPTSWISQSDSGKMRQLGLYHLNWREKRVKVRQSRTLYEKIHISLQAQLSPRIEQLIKIMNEGLKSIDARNSAIPITVGEIDQIITYVPDFYQRIQKARASARSQQNSEKNSVKIPAKTPEEMRQALEDIKKDLILLHQLTVAAHETHTKLIGIKADMDQVDDKAWSLYQAIDNAMDEVTVNNTFEELRALHEYIESTYHYVHEQLHSYFEYILKLVAQTHATIVQQIATAKKEGIPITKQEVLPPVPSKEAQTAPSSWVTWLLSPFIMFWNWIRGFFS